MHRAVGCSRGNPLPQALCREAGLKQQFLPCGPKALCVFLQKPDAVQGECGRNAHMVGLSKVISGCFAY